MYERVQFGKDVGRRQAATKHGKNGQINWLIAIVRLLTTAVAMSMALVAK